MIVDLLQNQTLTTLAQLLQHFASGRWFATSYKIVIYSKSNLGKYNIVICCIFTIKGEM